jgi:hypothetical protein
MSALEKLNGSVEKLANLRKELESTLVKTLQEFIAESPEIVALGWYQYTPSFNDGDACTFTLGDVHVRLAPAEGEKYEDEDSEDGLEGEGWYEEYQLRSEGPTGLHEKVEKLSEALNELENVLNGMFGDATIIVTSDGILTEEYDCGY